MTNDSKKTPKPTSGDQQQERTGASQTKIIEISQRTVFWIAIAAVALVGVFGGFITGFMVANHANKPTSNGLQRNLHSSTQFPGNTFNSMPGYGRPGSSIDDDDSDSEDDTSESSESDSTSAEN